MDGSRDCLATFELAFERGGHLAGSRAVAWLETGTASPHQECPSRHSTSDRGGCSCSSLGSIPIRDLIQRRSSIVTSKSSASCWCSPIVSNASGCCGGRHRSNRGCGRSKERPVTARCWHSSWSRRARSWSTCPRRCRHGHGCWTRVARTRPTRTMHVRLRSWRCGTGTCGRSRSRITARCYACWRGGITN